MSQGNKGKLGLFIGNKRQEQLSDFDLTLGVQSPDLTCVCSSAGSTIAPRQQMQLTASVECLAPFLAAPPLTIKFTSAGEQVCGVVVLVLRRCCVGVASYRNATNGGGAYSGS